MLKPKHPLMILLTLPLTTACSNPDERLIELSERANARQHAQNEVIARQSEKTTELTEGFVDAEAEARKELLQLQKELVDADAEARKDLQAIRAEIVQRDADGRRELDELHRRTHAAVAARIQTAEQQRDLLEQERKKIAADRARAPVVAEAVKFVGGLIVCLTPLFVVVYLMRCLRSDDGVAAATFDVLIDELMSDQPRLLHAQPQPRELPGPSAESGVR